MALPALGSVSLKHNRRWCSHFRGKESLVINSCGQLQIALVVAVTLVLIWAMSMTIFCHGITTGYAGDDFVDSVRFCNDFFPAPTDKGICMTKNLNICYKKNSFWKKNLPVWWNTLIISLRHCSRICKNNILVLLSLNFLNEFA